MTTLQVIKSGPGAAFTGQNVELNITVENVGSATATNVIVQDELPSEGSFISRDPPGSSSGTTLTIQLNNPLNPNETASVQIIWQTPSNEGSFINSRATASADNAAAVSDEEELRVGIQSVVTGGVVSAGWHWPSQPCRQNNPYSRHTSWGVCHPGRTCVGNCLHKSNTK
jgi:uncharacterized repeat protein (TIGR01451 family)